MKKGSKLSPETVDKMVLKLLGNQHALGKHWKLSNETKKKICLKRGGRVEADHYPKKFSDIFKENDIQNFEQAEKCQEFWNLNNGRTLCYDCHQETKKICPDSQTL